MRFQAAVLCLCVALVACRRQPPEDIDDLGVVPAWSMTAEDGKPIGTAQLQGKTWVVNFLFTSCPTSCPPLARATARLQERIRALLPKGEVPPVQIVSISVDPETDTPPVLAKMSAAPVENPIGESISPSSRLLKSMPADSIMNPSSRVVRT